jgi:hypothetical protein
MTILPTLFADCLEIWEPQPHGILPACQGAQLDGFTLAVITNNCIDTMV